jgi:hypothetical protein
MNSAEPPLLLAAHLAPPSRSNAQDDNATSIVGDGDGEMDGDGDGDGEMDGDGDGDGEMDGDGDSFTSSGTLSEFRAYAAKTPILIVEIAKASRQRTRIFRLQALLVFKLKTPT